MTQNNHSEMKTVVETFVIEETKELIYDNEQLDKWNAHVRELGLTGQTKIVQGEKSPIPFMHMKQTTVKMFEVLCPRQVDVSAYDVTPIPVEILELIALSRRENYFPKIEIWYDDKSPDPVCVGTTGYWGEYTWSASANKDLKAMEFESEEAIKKAGGTYYGFYPKGKYLLGKWADVKASFAELRERARQRFITEQGATLRKEIKEAQRKLDDLETTAIEMLGG